MMKNALILGVLAAVISVGSVPAKAQSTQATQVAKRCPYCGKFHAPRVDRRVSYSQQQQPQVQSAPTTTRRVYSAPPQQKSFMGRLWEMEQRKNAWLMRTFLGR